MKQLRQEILPFIQSKVVDTMNTVFMQHTVFEDLIKQVVDEKLLVYLEETKKKYLAKEEEYKK